jgi:membrane fusion protein, multidrug efflux system
VRAERDRYKTLLDRQMVSRSQFDNAENLYRSGEAKLQQIKAEQDVASNQAGYAVLRAPQDGVVAKRAGGSRASGVGRANRVHPGHRWRA